MKATVRIKLFLIMSGLIVFFVSLSWFVNNRWLEKFYLEDKKNGMIKSYQAITEIYQGEWPKVEERLERLENIKGMHILILDSDLEPKYDSYFKIRERKNDRKPRERFGVLIRRMPIFERLETLQPGAFLLGKVRDSRLQSDFLHLGARFGNGDYLMMVASVAAVQESVAIANRFFLLTGALTIVLGAILIYWLSTRFTRPIIDLREIAVRMSGLDFGRKYQGGAKDEIGELGASLNSLSEQLELSISDLKKANQQLQADIERERKVDEMRKEFISSVSHELKTPIALIQGYAEGLKVNVNEDEESKNFYCDVIVDEAAKMNRLVKQLLDLSQLESGYLHPDRVDFDLVVLVEKVLKRNALIFRDRGITIAAKIEPGLTVNADPDLAEQVFGNYLSNAVNHADGPRIVTVVAWGREDKVRLTVFNSGAAIPEESLEKVWGSFYKVDKARTRAYGGTGLGLSIVRAIQEAHHNGYGVANVPGGVEFWFEMDAGRDGMLKTNDEKSFG